jgi:phosphatidate phosphatase APP1
MSLKIIGYRGLGNRQKIIVSGHAFAKHKLWKNSPQHKDMHNFRQTLRRFRLRPIKNAILDIHVNGDVLKVRTDRRGFFTSIFGHEHRAPGWYPYKVKWNHNDVEYGGEYCVADEHTTGVISDIDDTLLISHSTRFLRKLRLMLFRNAYTRKPTPLIKHWFGHFKDINENLHPEDFFYVSNSEWNLYDFLVDFFDINDLPKGVFFLQNLKKGLRDLVSSGRIKSNHKWESILFLFRFYPTKPFILIGDNGQKDMEIYSRICHRYPERIKGVMIRKLSYIRNEWRYESFKEDISSLNIPVTHFH